MITTHRKGLVDQIESLPPFPAVATRLVSACESERLSAEQIGRIISEDPALAARILRIANSPFYGAAGKITQVSRAVVRLGTIAVRSLVIGMCASDAFGCGTGDSSHRTLWRHSVATAVAAEAIATRIGHKPAEESFLAGLLHDIGQLAIAKLQPEDFERILAQTSSGVELLNVEQRLIGTDHARLGVRILSRWGLPDTLCSVVGNHHFAAEEVLKKGDRFLAITMLADIFAELLGFGFDVNSGSGDSLAQLSAYLGLTPSDERLILDAIMQRTDDAFAMFEARDPADADRAGSGKRAIWVGPADAKSRIGPLLLEQLGYETRIVAGDDFRVEDAVEATVFVAMPDASAARSVADSALIAGANSIVILEDNAERCCRRTPGTTARVCTIPRVFSVFDIVWVEGQ